MKSDKIKKVLIALDYDPTAQKVAETGFKLASTMGAETVLLHIISDPVYYTAAGYSPIMGFSGYGDMTQLISESNDELKKASQQFLDQSKHHLGDANIKTLITEGDFADSILTVANEIKADVIVMGSHSRKWLENILMGSVTQKVLHRTTTPLFIVPTKKHS